MGKGRREERGMEGKGEERVEKISERERGGEGGEGKRSSIALGCETITGGWPMTSRAYVLFFTACNRLKPRARLPIESGVHGLWSLNSMLLSSCLSGNDMLAFQELLPSHVLCPRNRLSVQATSMFQTLF